MSLELGKVDPMLLKMLALQELCYLGWPQSQSPWLVSHLEGKGSSLFPWVVGVKVHWNSQGYTTGRHYWDPGWPAVIIYMLAWLQSFFFMVNNSILQSTLALLSAQSFYNERARVGHGDPTLSTVTPSTLGQLNQSQRAMRPCQAVSNVDMDVSVTDML